MAANNFTDGFAERLRLARERVGLTQRELGAIAEVNYSQISRYEQGLAFPRPGVLLKLAHALGTSMEHLRDGEPMEKIEFLFGDREPIAILMSRADMQAVREAAALNGRTPEEEFTLMFRAGMERLSQDPGFIAAEKAKPKKR